MKKEVYFVRHAESEGNRLRVHQGDKVELSKRGQIQAKILTKRLNKIPVEVIVCSPFVRTLQTASTINHKLQRPLITSDLLVEVKSPSELVGKGRDDENVIKIRQTLEDNFHNQDWRYSDEENFADRYQRAKDALKFIESLPYKKILVVTHAHFLSTLLGVMVFNEDLTSKLLLELGDHFRTFNTGITLCRVENGYWHVVTWNDYAHLS